MQRPLLAFVLTALFFALPEAARAAEPGSGGTSADPFAPAPEAKDPSSVEDQEAAVLGTPSPPTPAPSQGPPAVQPYPAAPRRAPPRTRRQANDEDRASTGASTPAVDQRGVAIELSTSGFASGPLTGGVFVGGRSGSGLILGGFLDYAMASFSATEPGGTTEVTTSAQAVRVGFGMRFAFVQSADRMVDLFGAADVSLELRSADVPSTTGPAPTENVAASGFGLALGPGLRLWVHEKIAVGYVARLRATYLTGEVGALRAPATDDMLNASATTIGLDGTFQLLGVF